MEGELGTGLRYAVLLLGAGVLAVPIFRWLGLGSVLGYLAAGLLIGPFGIGLFNDAQALMHVAELGVVLFLFTIGLEMRPTKLWEMRGEIFGLGLTQVMLCALLLTGVAMLIGLPFIAAAIGAWGFVLSSTAVIIMMLTESGQAGTPLGRRAVAILLLEDLMIIPLLAAISLAGTLYGPGSRENDQPLLLSLTYGVVTIVALIAAGRWLLDPLFRILARAGARDAMTAAALLVVLGAALVMEEGGWSMAMGAFLAGVLLSESSFRHQLEADINPFRGILLGLFFLSVGMALDLRLVLAQWPLVLICVGVFMAVKAIGIYTVARIFKGSHREAIKRAVLFAQGGEFAFVLFGAAISAKILDPNLAAILSAVVILSMALTPLLSIIANRFLRPLEPSMDGVDRADGLEARVLIIGFGRFAQIVCQALLARHVKVSLIENDVDRIRAAEGYGFKVYYGDGTRRDVLEASGAEEADMILICVNDPKDADRIVEIAQAEFPRTHLYVRAYDRDHDLRLQKAGVAYHLRDTLESALLFGQKVLEGLGFDHDVAAETSRDIRERDLERLQKQLREGNRAGQSLLHSNREPPPGDRQKYDG